MMKHACAADVLALARLDDDGVPPVVTPPARDGRGRYPIRLAGAGQVITGQGRPCPDSSCSSAPKPVA